MTSQGRRAYEVLARLLILVKQQSAFLKSGYALRSAVGVGIFAICHASLQSESARQGGNSRLLQWSQGCLWGAITVLTGVKLREGSLDMCVLISTQIAPVLLTSCRGGLALMCILVQSKRVTLCSQLSHLGQDCEAEL